MPILKKDLEECYDKTYEQVQEKLVELSAVYGNMIIERIGGQWQYDKIHKETSFDSKPLYINYPVLSLFVSYWQEKNAEKMVKNYVDTISGYQEWVLQCKQAYGSEWDKWNTSWMGGRRRLLVRWSVGAVCFWLLQEMWSGKNVTK